MFMWLLMFIVPQTWVDQRLSSFIEHLSSSIRWCKFFPCRKIKMRRTGKTNKSVILFLKIEINTSFWSQKLVQTHYQCLEFVTSTYFEMNCSSLYSTQNWDMCHHCHGTIDSLVIAYWSWRVKVSFYVGRFDHGILVEMWSSHGGTYISTRMLWASGLHGNRSLETVKRETLFKPCMERNYQFHTQLYQNYARFMMGVDQE